jgi:hypothetical protein
MMKKLILAIFLLPVSVALTPAQSSAEQSIIRARDQFFDIKNRSTELELIKRDASKRPVSRDVPLEFPKIKEDFEEIQEINSEVFKLSAAGTPIDLKTVLKLVSKINQRAVRLRSNLFQAEPKKPKESQIKQPTAAEPQSLKTLLTALDDSINSFVHNSMFQNLNLVNPADSLKAQKDLETVIKVSSAIKEGAKK